MRFELVMWRREGKNPTLAAPHLLSDKGVSKEKKKKGKRGLSLYVEHVPLDRSDNSSFIFSFILFFSLRFLPPSRKVNCSRTILIT